MDRENGLGGALVERQSGHGAVIGSRPRLLRQGTPSECWELLAPDGSLSLVLCWPRAKMLHCLAF